MLKPLNNNILVKLIESKNNNVLLMNEEKMIKEGIVINVSIESKFKVDSIVIFDITKANKYEEYYMINEKELLALKED